MAVILNVNSAFSYNGTSSSLSVPIGDNADGDMIVIAYRIRSTGSTVSATGFTHAYSATTTAWKVGFLYKVNSGSATTSPVTVSSTFSSYFVATSYVIRGQAASPIGNTGNSSSTGTTRLLSATCTTSSANSLIIHSVGHDGGYFQPEVGTFNLLHTQTTANGTGSTGSDAVASSGVSVPTFYWNNVDSRQIVDAILEIKSAATSAPVCITPARTVIAYHGGYDPSPLTQSAPNSVTGLTAISGVNMSSSLPTVSTGGSNWTFVGLRMDTSVATTQWEGLFETVSLNLSGKTLVVPWSINRAPATDGRIGIYGMIVVLVDGSNNWVAYTMRDEVDWWVANATYTTFVKHGSTPQFAASASAIDITNVVKIGYFHHRSATGGAGTTTFNIGTVWYESGNTVVTGGNSSAPLDSEKIARHMKCAGQWFDIAPYQGKGQFLNKLNLQIGNGSVPTYFKSTGQSFEYPAANGIDWTLAAGDIGITLKASSTCTMDLSASIFSAASLQSFTVDAASSTSATYNFTGASFIGLNWAANASINFGSASYTQCNLTELGGGTVSNSSVTYPVGTTATTVSTSGGTLDNVSISSTKADGSNSDYHITYGTGVTAATLTDVTFSGTPAVDKVHVLKTSGTVTISINGTTSLSAGDVTSAGATVVIASSPVYQKVTVSGFTAGSRIQIYDTSSSTELFNGTASSGNTVVSGSTAVWTDPSVASASRAIRIRVAYVSGTSANEFIETSGLTCGVSTGYEITYPVTSTADTTYNSNAIDGPSIYATSGITFTDAATDLVNCNIAGGSVTYPTIYACFVYWNFTSSGIANDFTYISAPDTANYLLSGMKIRNTSATDLTVTGGYGRDATSGLSKDIIDTAGSTGNIFLAPDHVVAYATGSGSLTAGDITNIWSAATRTVTNTIPTASDNASAVLSAAQTTPIHADTKKMNGADVLGTGTSADKWRGE